MSGNTKGSTPLKPPDDLPTLPTLPPTRAAEPRAFALLWLECPRRPLVHLGGWDDPIVGCFFVSRGIP